MSCETDFDFPQPIRHDDLQIPIGSDTVAATRFEPSRYDDPLPIIFMYIPYHKDDMFTFSGQIPTIRYLTAHGYEVIVGDLVGTGASSGTKPEPFTPEEGEEAAAVIDWLANQEWSTGRIGMFGSSYGGLTCLWAASQQPDALEAIVPIVTTQSSYEVQRGGSIFNYLMAGDWAPRMQTLQAMPPSRRDDEGRWSEIWKQRLESLRESTPWLFQFLDHESKDEYWQKRDIPVEKIEVPTFAVGGVRDIYSRDTVRYFENIDSPKRLLLGPWRHVLPETGRESAIDFRRQTVEWFDYHLKDTDNGAMDRPTIAYWTERNGGTQIDDGVWRKTKSWPAAEESGTETLSFALASERLVDSNTFETGEVRRKYEYDHTVGINSADTGIMFSGASDLEDTLDTNPDDVRSLYFETTPLSQPTEFTGTGSATIRIIPSTQDLVLAVRVIDVSPDGNARLVSHGQTLASHWNNPKSKEPLTPGEEYEITFPLKPKSHIFETGHRIRVAVSAAYLPLILPPREHGSFTLLSTPNNSSTITFPGKVHDGGVSFDDTVEMQPPDDRLPVQSEYLLNSSESWSIARNPLTDAATFATTIGNTVDLPHGEMRFSEDIDIHVKACDPKTAAVTHHSKVILEYDTETVHVETRARVSRDATKMMTQAKIDENKVFEETWTR